MQINPSHRTQNWKMLNISAGGYSLLWDNLETTRAQVGELLPVVARHLAEQAALAAPSG